MVAILKQDYQAMSNMIFGPTPNFDEIICVIHELEELINTPRDLLRYEMEMINNEI